LIKNVSVVIPVKNEPYLPSLLLDIKKYLKIPYETRIQTECGLSNAVLCGIKLSKGEAIIIIDGDGSHPVSAIPSMIKLLDKYDIVVGSRYVQGGKTEDYTVRMLLSRLFCKLAKTVLGLSINDNMSGFLVIKRKVFKQLSLNPFGYKFGTEILLKSKNKFKVCEYPVVFEKRKMGYSKTGIIQGVRTLAFIFRLWLSK